MQVLKVTIGPYSFLARMEEGSAPCTCAAFMGQLAGNHFLTVVEGAEQLHPMGRQILWEGAQDIIFELQPGVSRQ